MTRTTPSPTAAQKKKKEALAKALKANLRRRKAVTGKERRT